MTDDDRSTTNDAALRKELIALLNKYSCENPSSTPDFVLADYLLACLRVWAEATNARSRYFEDW